MLSTVSLSIAGSPGPLERKRPSDSLSSSAIGAFHGKGKRTGTFGAYLLACYAPDAEEFQTVCKIGTGFSDEQLAAFTAAAQPHIVGSGRKPREYRVGKTLGTGTFGKVREPRRRHRHTQQQLLLP